MLMTFGVAERLTLLATLPPEGDILTLKIVRKLKDELSLSEEELTSLHVVQNGDQITWQNEKEVPKEIFISPKTHEVISEALKRMNDRKQLRLEHVSLYERFVEAPD